MPNERQCLSWSQRSTRHASRAIYPPRSVYLYSTASAMDKRVSSSRHGRTRPEEMGRPATQSKTPKSSLGLPGRRVRPKIQCARNVPSVARVAAGAFGFLTLIQVLDGCLIPSFWVKLDTSKRLGGNQKRLACPFLNFTPNKIMQTPRNIRLLALLNLGNVFPSEAIGRIV